MPRATRAALRAQELAEEAASVELPPTPSKERVPLGEISHNTGAHAVMRLEDDSLKQPADKAKKGKAGKKGRKGKKGKAEKENNEILEDENESLPSDAAEEASNELLHTTGAGTDANVIPDRTTTPPSPAVELATKHLENTSIAEDESMATGEGLHKQAHTLVGDISQTNASGSANADVISVSANEDAEDAPQDDSFIDRIQSRSPAKRVSRIEDSVEALDQLEDEIEKVGQAIPATASDHSSPTDTRKSTRKTKAKAPTERSSKQTSKASTPRPDLTSAKPVGTKPAASKATKQPVGVARNVNTKTSVAPSPSRTSGMHKPAPPSKSQPPPPASRRVSSIHKTPFQPVKSTKPTTKSTFELPGEAIARKLKEQREERQKREEEMQAKKQSSKAKPARPSQVPEVKMTATARARLSMAQQSSNEQFKPAMASQSCGKSFSASVKPQSGSGKVAGQTAQPSRKKSPSSPNISVKRGPSLSAAVTSRQPFSSSVGRSGPSAEQIANQKTRGKEVFGRHRMLLSEKESEKKAKEEAARKARIEAAERGRLASREWAEKQKARKLAAQKSKPMEQ